MRSPCGVIAFLTDFGTKDPYVAAMKGVALSICPNAVLVDITHEIPSFDIETAAYTLLNVYRYYPPGTVFVVVVDPGVGSKRRALLVVSRNYYFVGPDNGVLIPAAEDDGIEFAISLENDVYFLKPISASFHGRDVFTPVAAWLCRGVAPTCFGPRVDVSSLVRPKTSVWMEALGSCVRLRAIYIDRFGNIVLSQRFPEVVRVLGLSLGDRVIVICRDRRVEAVVSRVFSEVRPGTMVLYENSFGWSELAVYMGSAAEMLNAERGSIIDICRC